VFPSQRHDISQDLTARGERIKEVLSKTTKKDLFVAWQHWCDGEGEDAGTQHTFTKEVAKRGIILGFREGRGDGGVRVWRDLGLKSDPDPEVSVGKNPRKHIGISDSNRHSSENSTNSSLGDSHVEGFGENDEKVSERQLDEIIPLDYREWTARYEEI
jgi:hypothetical protein